MAAYIGFEKGTGMVSVFTSAKKPTEESHGRYYNAATGPYRTKAAATADALRYYGRVREAQDALGLRPLPLGK